MILYIVGSILVMMCLGLITAVAVMDAHTYRDLYRELDITFSISCPKQYAEWQERRRKS